MIKAIFLDMDETLCATSLADTKTRLWLQDDLLAPFTALDREKWAERYFLGVYKKLHDEFPSLASILPDESRFRCQLVKSLFQEQGVTVPDEQCSKIQGEIDQKRMAFFDFFPGVKSLLRELRKHYTLVVITNGPVFSQHPKLAAVGMSDWVDHIIVGGEEPEEKPALSIFSKALALAEIDPSEAIHVGDSIPSDIIGARNAHITSVWISPLSKSDSLTSGSSEADFTLSSITDLPSVLNKIRN